MDKQIEFGAESVPKTYSNIIDEVSRYYIKRGTLYIIFKICKQTKKLLIHLKYKKDTELNPFQTDLIFTIIIHENYPIEAPDIYSMTNFCYPSLFDHRNLLFSVLGHNWVKISLSDFEPLNSRKDIEPLEEIIQEIPKLLRKIQDNFNNKVLIYYGSYKIDKEYDINDLIVNQKMLLYRVYHYSNKIKHKKTHKYLIVTDINILLFSIPNDQKKNIGKLQFWGNIKLMVNLKERDLNMENNEKIYIVKIEWQNEKKKVSFKIGFIDKKRKEFINIISEKKNRLNDNYNMFLDDLFKPSIYQDIIMNQGKSEIKSIINDILQQIEFYEKIFTNNKNLHAGKQLIVLYQKIIEFYSLNDNYNFQPYMLKLKKLLEDPSIKDELKKESPTECKNLFEEKLFD